MVTTLAELNKCVEILSKVNYGKFIIHVCEYLFIGFIQWEVKRLNTFWVVEMVEWSNNLDNHSSNKERIIGADGEFTASPHVKKLSLLQLATATTAFLLDMTALSSTVTEVALWQPFIDLFTNKDILIVGT